MDKKALRAQMREKKRALSAQQIERASALLAQQLFAHPAYRAARSIYGYLSYNQEVRTLPILEQAQRDGKRVAVPKVFGDEMKFLWLDDLTAIAPGAYRKPSSRAVWVMRSMWKPLLSCEIESGRRQGQRQSFPVVTSATCPISENTEGSTPSTAAVSVLTVMMPPSIR